MTFVETGCKNTFCKYCPERKLGKVVITDYQFPPPPSNVDCDGNDWSACC